MTKLVFIGILGGVIVAAGCAPRLRPLAGDLTPMDLPRAELPRGHRQITFAWEYSDPDMVGRGDGVARVAAPDSVRLDFFLAGGAISGMAVLIGDSLDVPGIELMRRLIPPPPMLWGALGRAALPVTRDTAVRRDVDLLRADIGNPVTWRVAFRGEMLVRLERVDAGRVIEWVARDTANEVEYRRETARRSLKLHITRVDNVTAFDPTIWHIDH